MSVKTASGGKRKDGDVKRTDRALGPLPCTLCRVLVRWVRVDGVLVLVDAATAVPHVCGAR